VIVDVKKDKSVLAMNVIVMMNVTAVMIVVVMMSAIVAIAMIVKKMLDVVVTVVDVADAEAWMMLQLVKF
jgi:hypothetical protein